MGPKEIPISGDAWRGASEEFQPAGNSFGLDFIGHGQDRHGKLHRQRMSGCNRSISVQGEAEQAATAVPGDNAVRVHVDGFGRSQNHNQQQAECSHPALEGGCSELAVLHHFTGHAPGRLTGAGTLRNRLIIPDSKGVPHKPAETWFSINCNRAACPAPVYQRAASFPGWQAGK